jgi:predicted transcriptional regulator
MLASIAPYALTIGVTALAVAFAWAVASSEKQDNRVRSAGQAATVRLNVVLSDTLNSEIEKVAQERAMTKADVLRKAIALYLAASEGRDKGLKVGLAKPEQQLETEFVGV